MTTAKSGSGPTAADLYFAHLCVIDEAQRIGDLETVILQCRASLKWVRGALAEERKETSQQTFTVPPYSHLAHQLPLFLAERELLALRDHARGTVGSGEHTSLLDAAIEACKKAASAYQYISDNPGCIQADVKKLFPGADSALYYGAAYGYLKREKAGRSFKLWVIERPSGEIDFSRIRPRIVRKLTTAEQAELFDGAVRQAVDGRRAVAELRRSCQERGGRGGRRSKTAAIQHPRPGCLVLIALCVLATMGWIYF